MMKKRTLVIGDIHSGLRALHQVLERAVVQTDDTLIFLGDYVDGWSEAVETVNYLIELSTTHHCIFIRGNHDELVSNWLSSGKDNPLWFKHGGEATSISYGKADSHTKEKHISFYEDLKDYYLDAENRLFLHAGFTNLKGVEYEYFGKTFYWDRTLWELAQAMDPTLEKTAANYPKRLAHYKEIFIGHTPISKTSYAEPKQAATVWNLDSGAAFRGPLSLMDVDTKQIWVSEPVENLYPGETGRN